MSSPIFDYLNAINYTKEDILDDDLGEKEYDRMKFSLNRFLSGTIDSVLYANEMNIRPSVSPRMHFDYLRFSLRKKKRFSKWLKKDIDDKIELIQEYYGLSYRRAREVVDLITDEQYKNMIAELDRGGRK